METLETTIQKAKWKFYRAADRMHKTLTEAGDFLDSTDRELRDALNMFLIQEDDNMKANPPCSCANPSPGIEMDGPNKGECRCDNCKKRFEAF